MCFEMYDLFKETHGPRDRVSHRRVDVKHSCHHVFVDPAGAPVFGFAIGGCVIVLLSLHFGWRNSPGVWALMAAALEHTRTHSVSQREGVSPQEVVAVEHVELALSPGVPVKSRPRDWRPVPRAGGYSGSYITVRHYVDDGILVEK